MRHLERGGRYLRVADPSWSDPLSPTYARRRGGRWNAPGRFGVVYLNASLAVARSQVRHKLETRGIRPEDLARDQGPVLVHTHIPEDRFIDAVSAAGLRAIGLPRTYPLDETGQPVPHERCQPIGQAAWDAGEPGIACRSAATLSPDGGEELAFFARRRLSVDTVEDYADWFW